MNATATFFLTYLLPQQRLASGAPAHALTSRHEQRRHRQRHAAAKAPAHSPGAPPAILSSFLSSFPYQAQLRASFKSAFLLSVFLNRNLDLSSEPPPPPQPPALATLLKEIIVIPHAPLPKQKFKMVKMHWHRPRSLRRSVASRAPRPRSTTSRCLSSSTTASRQYSRSPPLPLLSPSSPPPLPLLSPSPLLLLTLLFHLHQLHSRPHLLAEASNQRVQERSRRRL
jgi:hypothetical protein